MTKQPTDDSDRRFRYETVSFGNMTLGEGDYGTLPDAIEDMAADGWRFVDSTEHKAVFEKPA